MDGIFGDMGTFDFNAPVNETIIYDDDEDEDERNTILKTNEEAVNNNHTENNDLVIPMVNPEILGHHDNKIKGNKKEESEKNNDQMEDNELVKANKSTGYDIDPKNNCKALKRKRNICYETEYDVDIHYMKTALLDRESMKIEKTFEQSIETNSAGKKNGCLIEDNEHEMGNMELAPAVNDENRSVKQLPNKGKNGLDSGLCNQIDNEDDGEEFSDYIKGIFESTFQNLIHIVQAYNEYLKIIQCTAKSSSAVSNAKRTYMLHKNQYFQLSYCAVLNLIIPQEDKNNAKFTDEFINHTLKYALDNMNLTYSKQDLLPFYYELIAWVRGKKKTLDAKRKHNVVHENEEFKKKRGISNDTSALLKQLAQPPILPEYSNAQRIIQQPTRLGNTLLEESGSDKRHITSNLHVFQTPNPDFVIMSNNMPAKTPILPPYPNPVQPLSLPVRRLPEYQPPMLHGYSSFASKTGVPEPMNMAQTSTLARSSLYSNTPQYQNWQRSLQPTNTTPIFKGGASDREVIISVDDNTLQNSYRNPQRLHPSYYNMMQTQDIYHNSTVSPRSQDNEYTNGSFATSIQNNYPIGPRRQNLNSCNILAMYRKPPAQPCHNLPYVHRQDYMVDSDGNREQLLSEPYGQNEPLKETIEHTRSSASTDSGFVSPLQFVNGTEKSTTSEEGRLDLLITHVTSLNPNAMQIVEGSCFICHARTKKKCLGCYLVYYCSTACQVMDWGKHKDNCRIVQNNRASKTD